MNVNLSSTFEDYIKQQLDSGLYNNASEVIRDALRQKMQSEEVYKTKLEALRAAISDGMNSGDPVPFDVNDLICEAKQDAGLNA
ncbi:MAG: antitoxin ParD1/3/4 [Paraglaciecola sp.]|jgi:antitoxin ParD1/3/4